MLFNTFHFAYFFAILFPIYWVLPHRLQNLLLLAASYYFYACWEPRFLTLLVLSTLMDYACGLAVDRIEEPWRRKLFVALSMALNLGMLGYFKYYNSLVSVDAVSDSSSCQDNWNQRALPESVANHVVGLAMPVIHNCFAVKTSVIPRSGGARFL